MTDEEEDIDALALEDFENDADVDEMLADSFDDEDSDL